MSLEEGPQPALQSPGDNQEDKTGAGQKVGHAETQLCVGQTNSTTHATECTHTADVLLCGTKTRPAALVCVCVFVLHLWNSAGVLRG